MTPPDDKAGNINDTTPSTLVKHSRNYKDMVTRTGRYGMLDKPDGYGKRTGDCNDTIEIFLSIRANRIEMVTFIVDGCANTIACGNTVSMLVEGRSITDAWQLSPENVINYLETLPEDHHHCAELAVGAFYKALTNYNRRLKEAWKNEYPNHG